MLLCGGLGGVMAAAAQGAQEAGGVSLGILPEADRRRANPYLTYSLATNLGHARNVLIAHSADALIAVDGDYGTISEAAIALKLGKPVVALKADWNLARPAESRRRPGSRGPGLGGVGERIRRKLREGARGRRPLPPPSNSLPQPLRLIKTNRGRRSLRLRLPRTSYTGWERAGMKSLDLPQKFCPIFLKTAPVGGRRIPWRLRRRAD